MMIAPLGMRVVVSTLIILSPLIISVPFFITFSGETTIYAFVNAK